MATKSVIQHTVVTPAEWIKKTSIFKFGQGRGTETEGLDSAYTRWYNSRGHVFEEQHRNVLQDELQSYYSNHGGDWAKLARNKKSNGLMKYIFDLVYKANPVTAAGREATERDNAHSRYGVMYLLGNIDINMDYFGIVLEGAGAVGGALASGFGTNFDQLKDADKVDKSAFKVSNPFGSKAIDVSVSDAFTYSSGPGMAGIKAIGGQIMAPGAPLAGPTTQQISVMNPTAMHNRARRGGFSGALPTKGSNLSQGAGKGPPCAVGNMNHLRLAAGTKSLTTQPIQAQSDYGFPLTKKALLAMGNSEYRILSSNYSPVKGAVVIGTAFADMMLKIGELLISLVKSLVNWLIDKLKGAVKSPITVGVDLIKPIVMYAVKECAKAAVPFVSAGIDLLVGLGKSFNAIKMKVGAWLESRKIRIADGHPALLATRIEKCMTMDIAAGLWTMIKGAVQMALAATVPGAQSLVGAITSAVEWVIKFVMRLIEHAAVSLFLLTARVAYMTERKLTRQESGSPHRTVHTSGGKIHNLPRFKKFYQEGCDASPLIAMLTLNTGICGSQWQLQNMFTDLGTGRHGEVSQKEFDSGTQYFDRLKKYGLKYLADSGFEFKANPIIKSDARYVQGLLDKARYGFVKASLMQQPISSAPLAVAAPPGLTRR
jgi:hypothetical protein